MNEKTDDARRTRGECKMPGGKLVGVTLLWENGATDGAVSDAAAGKVMVVGARIDGDFLTDAPDGGAVVTPLLKTLGVVIADWLNTHGTDLPGGDGAADALAEAVDTVIRSLPKPPALVGTNARAIAVAALRAHREGAPVGSFRPVR